MSSHGNEPSPGRGPGIRASLYRPLAESDVERIADAAFEVLAEGGVAVHSPTGFEAFRAAGAAVDETTRIVRLPRALVEDAIDSNPSSITLFSRDGKLDAVLERDRVHYGTGGTAIYVLDPDSGERRPSTSEDVILNARLIDELPNVHVFTINVFPNEIENRDHIDVNRFFHALDNTTKHVMGGVYSPEGSKNVVKTVEVVAGSAPRNRGNGCRGPEERPTMNSQGQNDG